MNSVALIDLPILFRRHWHVNEHEEVSVAYQRSLSDVYTIAAQHDATLLCLDFPPYKRSEILPEYKAQREKPPEAMREQFRSLVKKLKSEGFPVLLAQGYEADDVIATAARQLKDSLTPARVTVYSGDKDLLQLVRTGVEVVSTATGERYDSDAVAKKLGVRPALVPQFLALTGDKADNIEGVKLVGPKRAAEWLNRFGSLQGIYDACTKSENKFTPTQVTNLAEARDRVSDNLRLITLFADAPISVAAEIANSTKPQEETMQEAEFEEESHGEPQPGEEKATTEPAPPPDEKPKAIVKANGNGNGSTGLQPAGLAQALQLAGALEKSRLYTEKFVNKEAILAVMVRGSEMGLGVLTALDNFHMIEGKPTMSAGLIQALATSHPDCQYFQMVKSTGEAATYRTHRRGHPGPTELTYTLEQAKAADLVKLTKKGLPNNWMKNPDDMLRKTAAVKLARIVYPDVAAGLYCPEEMA